MDWNILNVRNGSGQVIDCLELNAFTKQALLEHQERAPLTPEAPFHRMEMDYDFWYFQGMFAAYFPDEGTRYWMAKDWAKNSLRLWRRRYANENKEHAKHGEDVGGLLGALRAGNEGDSRGQKRCLSCILEQADLIPSESGRSTPGIKMLDEILLDSAEEFHEPLPQEYSWLEEEG